MIITTESDVMTAAGYSGSLHTTLKLNIKIGQFATIIDSNRGVPIAFTRSSVISLKGFNGDLDVLVSVSNASNPIGSWVAGVAKLKDIQAEIDKASSGGGSGGVDLPIGDIPSQLDAVVSLNNEPVKKQVLATTLNKYPVRGTADKFTHVVIGASLADEYGQVCIDAGGYVGEVMLMCWDLWGAEWKPNTLYSVGDILHPPAGLYPQLGCVYRCTAQGYGGATDPEWWPYSHSSASGVIGDAAFEAVPYLAPQVQGPITPYTQEQLENGNLKINGAEYLRGSPVMFGDIQVYPYIHGSETVYRRVDTGLPFIPII
ncbi:MAG: hypothetical protein ACRCYJ_00605, partial [Plesiomonas shigelloides]